VTAETKLAALLEPALDYSERLGIKPDRARLAAFAVADVNEAGGGLEISWAQGQGLADAKATAPEQHDEGAVAGSGWASVAGAEEGADLVGG
jgi:hypothetical protein